MNRNRILFVLVVGVIIAVGMAIDLPDHDANTAVVKDDTANMILGIFIVAVGVPLIMWAITEWCIERVRRWRR